MACSDDAVPAYAELHCLSNFTFLRGASHPEELVRRAARLGYRALALTDVCSVAGVVRAHREAKRRGLKLIVGTELALPGGATLVLLAMDRHGYGQLCRLVTRARRRAEKGRYRVEREDFSPSALDRCLALWPVDGVDEGAGAWLAQAFPGRLWIGVHHLLDGRDEARLERARRLGERLGVALCALGGVWMHSRARKPLQDLLTAVRLALPLARLGRRMEANGERHLRSLRRLERLYPRELLEETVAIAGRCRFDLDELRYAYPRELVPEGETPASWLRHLTREGMARRWPEGAPERVRRQVERELALIAELGYEPYFLTVHDLVAFARSRGILCQGRGSAANSAVCFCLGITAVDPARMNLLFERFISRERDEPPDIDVDFEHERREEVIQYIYRKYGRGRAALAATVVTYRPRSAIRDVGRALGLEQVQIERLARAVRGWEGLGPELLERLGFDPASPVMRRLVALVERLVGFPRHLSQHVGGFVISAGPLEELVPVENAAMAGRTVIQWDKDDLETLGLLKVDVLSLGMLTAIRKCLDYIRRSGGPDLTLATIPAEDPATYEMICRADTLGVFQIESRAQMAMLPRLRPRCYYDLVVQVAIVRPGPIQGEMVHPYLARRNGAEAVRYPGPEVERVLRRTLGVPIFQEQVMELAVVAAGFTPGEADQLRRAMAAWKRKGGLEPFERKLLRGMEARGYSRRFAEQIFQQIKGFGEYGFPESHAASFALLAYVSAWLKCHHPASFLCALLNSQPMGFYGPAQLVADARRHGVEVRPADVAASDWDCTLEEGAVRLGLRMVKGICAEVAEAITRARGEGPFESVEALAARAGLDRATVEALARAGALASITASRPRALWRAAGVEPEFPLLGRPRFPEAEPLLPALSRRDTVLADYAATGLSLAGHPLALLRRRLGRRRVRRSCELAALADGALARVAGVVVGRQRPGSARGVLFLTLEDEAGLANVVVWPGHARAQRRALLDGTILLVSGTVQRQEGVVHLLAGRLEAIDHWLGPLASRSRDFR